MRELPIAANESRRCLRASDRDSRQGHVDVVFLEETGFGSEPGGALPRRKKPGCRSRGSHSLRGTLGPNDLSGNGNGSAAGEQMQESSARGFAWVALLFWEMGERVLHSVLQIQASGIALPRLAGLDWAGMPLGLDGTAR